MCRPPGSPPRTAPQPGEVGEIGAGEVCTATEHFRHLRGKHRQHLLGGLASGHVLAVLREARHQLQGLGGEVGRQFALPAPLQFLGLGGVGLAVGGPGCAPGAFGVGAGAAGVPRTTDVAWDLERGVCPAQSLARGANLVCSQGFTVDLCRSGSIGRTLSNDRLADDQRRLVCGGFRLRQRRTHGVGIVTVHGIDHVSSRRHGNAKACRRRTTG